MIVYKYPATADWSSLLKRPVMEAVELEGRVLAILKEVQERGDAALIDFALKFDGAAPKSLLATDAEIAEAQGLVSEELKAAIQVAKNNIEKFHTAQKEAEIRVETMPGVNCWRKSLPIEKVGLYIPGGTAPLFSTILMLGVPATIAGCSQLVLCTPPNKEGKIHPAILYTAHLLGIKTIVKAGGAQGIAAMAFGTASVPKVYKIFGPGNQYVTTAKQLVTKYGVAIDMPAGPSEVAVVADKNANAAFVAADLLSQAEHGADSQVVLVSDSEDFINRVQTEVAAQLAKLSRKDLAAKALDNSKAFLVKDMNEAMEMINLYAPEHLILQVEDLDALVAKVVNAGSVFIGPYTPESAGDYASGTNHTLPTNGYATAYAGVSLDSFIRKVTFQKITKEGLQKIGPVIETMAAAEMLDAHKNAVTVRLQEIAKS
ncbi:histidinol dehydrogenase [Cytophaga aurantiaca]|uniref:histidinol dehydrogenase n=1 Tax=Cytophaga aurantiaca TaxID=29530 RepID=UPI00035E92D0|nr:histidinol dehydrogenase [Cytophaga aurantiaca]